MPNTPAGHPISAHALLRFQQRNITVQQIDACIANGVASAGRNGTTEHHNRYGGAGGGRRRANCLFVVTGGGTIVTAYRHHHR